MQLESTKIPTEKSVIVREPGQGEAVWFLDNLITVKLREADGAPFGLVENAMATGSRTPFHRHLHEDEGFYVLSGRLCLCLEGERRVIAEEGTYVHVPRGTVHALYALTDLRLLVLSDPGGFVEFTREMGVPAPRREVPPRVAPDHARLEAVAAKYGIELVAPPPEAPPGV
jgi:quercetin dioxygenase-like cupin family protein